MVKLRDEYESNGPFDHNIKEFFFLKTFLAVFNNLIACTLVVHVMCIEQRVEHVERVCVVHMLAVEQQRSGALCALPLPWPSVNLPQLGRAGSRGQGSGAGVALGGAMGFVVAAVCMSVCVRVSVRCVCSVVFRSSVFLPARARAVSALTAALRHFDLHL